jgi:hypothetical protein|nr:MAG TPA: hypothetical protein [Bacteriophage sp.]
MGLKLAIAEQDNVLYADFTDAYWKVDGIMFTNMDGESYVTFSLDAYPSREAAQKMLEPISCTGTISVGGAVGMAYEPRLWHWEASFKTMDVFPNGIPITESGQKDVLYQLVKAYTKMPFEDVLEQ